MYKVSVNLLVKLAQEKSEVRRTDRLHMTIAVDWDVKHQTKQTKHSIYFQPVTSSSACILARIVDRQQDAAQPLVKIFLHSEKLVPLIQRLAEHEIKRTV